MTAQQIELCRQKAKALYFKWQWKRGRKAEAMLEAANRLSWTVSVESSKGGAL